MPKPRSKSALTPPLTLELSSRHTLDIAAFARECLDFHPDPIQTQALDSNIRRGILNCCRQWGKSSTMAIRAVHQLLYEPGCLVIAAAPCERQSNELVLKVAHFLRRLSIPSRGDGQNTVSLVLPNRSRIVGVPGDSNNIRGFSNVSLLIVDEASRVPDHVYLCLRPMVATHHRSTIWLISTPNGRQGFFYSEWHNSDANWTRIEAAGPACPRIPAEYLAEERRTMPDMDFRREYLCEFLSADFSYFDPATIDAAFYRDKSVDDTPHPHAQSRHYLGLDLGQARDYSGVAILERRVEPLGTHDPVTFARHERTRILVNHIERIPLRTQYPDVVERIRALVEDRSRQKRHLEILLDATGVGAVVRDMLKRAGLGVPITGITITAGERVLVAHNVYHIPRHDLLANVRVLLEKRMLTVAASGPHVETLRSELLRWGDRSAHDDLVFAVALAAWKAGGQPLTLNGPGPLPLIYPEVRK